MAKPSTVNDVVTSTSLGTGVAETQINGGVSYVVPSWAHSLIEFTPVQYATGAVTAAQSFTPRFKIKSSSISGLEPKEIVIAPIASCLGATSSNTTPVLKSFKLNRGLAGANVNIDFYGQNQVANTVANAAGCSLKLSSYPAMGPEQYYQASTDETASAVTAIATDGGSIVINNATALNMWYGQLMPVTVVASESYAGYMELNSSDYSGDANRIRFWPYQITAGLSTLITTIVPDQMYYEGYQPVNSTCTLTPRFQQQEAVNAAYNFIAGVGFVR